MILIQSIVALRHHWFKFSRCSLRSIRGHQLQARSLDQQHDL